MSFEQKYFVFDVESCGLHGQGFAVGFVVIDSSGKILDEGLYCRDHTKLYCSSENEIWLKENIPPMKITHDTLADMRSAFWSKWMQWQGCTMVTDCGWPVESNFLSECIADDFVNRQWKGPYPLLDLSGILFCKGFSPTTTFPRLESEMPLHNPLNDARQSARILMLLLNDNFEELISE